MKPSNNEARLVAGDTRTAYSDFRAYHLSSSQAGPGLLTTVIIKCPLVIAPQLYHNEMNSDLAIVRSAVLQDVLITVGVRQRIVLLTLGHCLGALVPIPNTREKKV